MASVVGKTIFSDGKGKLFFGYYKDNDAVEFVDYKTWKKLNFKDVSKGDTNKERVIKAIVKNQKQFNKKVDFNMWAKKQRRSFEDTMDWFIKNGWVSNITKRGIKEGVEDVLSINESMKPSQVRSAISKVKKQLMRKWKQKGGYENFGQKELSQMKDKFDYNPYGSSDERQISKMLDGFDDWAMNYDGSMREDRNSNMFYVLYQKKGVFGKPSAAGYKDRKDAEKFAKSLGSNHNTMILDKQSMKNVKGVDVKESVNEVAYNDAIAKFNKDLEKNSQVKRIAKFYKKNVKDIVKALQPKITVLRYSDKSIKLVSINFTDKDSKVKVHVSQTYKQNESVNESASKEAMGIAALTGTRGSAVQDFIDKNRINSRKLFNALKKANLQGRINFASALSGKPGNPNQKLTIKLFGEDKGEVEKIKKQVGKNEIKFYDALSKVEKRLGSKYPKFLDTALKQLKQNPFSLKTNADKEEKLFNLVK